MSACAMSRRKIVVTSVTVALMSTGWCSPGCLRTMARIRRTIDPARSASPRDVDERLVQIIAVGPRRGQHAARSVRVRGDRGQRLVDLVRDRRRELADGRDALRVGELLAARARLILRALAPRPLHQQHGDERALRRDHDHRRDDVALVEIPDRRLPEADDAAGGQPALVDAATAGADCQSNRYGLSASTMSAGPSRSPPRIRSASCAAVTPWEAKSRKRPPTAPRPSMFGVTA